MAGLARICKIYGHMKINGKMFVWDYVADETVPEGDMLPGTTRWKASEEARHEGLRELSDGPKQR